MTTIVHDRTYRWHKSYAYRDHLPDLDQFGRFQCEAYLCADANYPPHYPMPAIPLQVVYGTWSVWIINPHTPYDGMEWYREEG